MTAGEGDDEPSRLSLWVETSRLALALVLAALVLVPSALVALHLEAYPELSPIDEQSHADYVSRAPGLLPVRSGDRWVEEVLRAEACRGIDSSFEPPPCDAPVLRPEQFELQGYNTSYIHPPAYYNVTAVAAEGIEGVGLSADWFGAARATGALWLSAGLLLTYVAGRLLGCRRVPLLGVLLLLAASPGVVFMSATVTPDAANVLVGAAVLVALVVADRRPSAWALGLAVVAGLAVTGIKLQNAVVLLPAAIFLVLRAVDRSRERGTWRSLPRDPGLAVGAALAVPAVTLAAGWAALYRSEAVVPPEDLPITGLLAGDVVGLGIQSFGQFLPPTLLYVPPVLTALAVLAWSQVTDWWIVAGLVATVLVPAAFTGGAPPAAEQGRTVLALGRGALVTAVVGGPVLLLLSVVILGDSFPLPDRYGATLLPIMLVVVAAAVRGRRVGWLLLVCALVGVGLEGLALWEERGR